MSSLSRPPCSSLPSSRPAVLPVFVGNSTLTVDLAKDFGIILASSLSFTAHTQSFRKSCWFSLQNTPHLTLAQTTVIPHLDYYNSLLTILSLCILALLFPILNTAANVIPLKHKSDHMTPLLKNNPAVVAQFTYHQSPSPNLELKHPTWSNLSLLWAALLLAPCLSPEGSSLLVLKDANSLRTSNLDRGHACRLQQPPPPPPLYLYDQFPSLLQMCARKSRFQQSHTKHTTYQEDDLLRFIRQLSADTQLSQHIRSTKCLNNEFQHHPFLYVLVNTLERGRQTRFHWPISCFYK